MKVDNNSFERVEQVKYLGTNLMDQKSKKEEIKSRLKSENACYPSVQNPLPSSLLSKNINVKIYRNIILHVVLYGCEIWCLILREEHRLRIFANRLPRKIFGPRRDEVTGRWWRLHNEELYEMYFLPNNIRVTKSRRVKWTGDIAHMGNRRGAYRILVRKPDGKRPFGRPRL
jgi:hypothetical protein